MISHKLISTLAPVIKQTGIMTVAVLTSTHVITSDYPVNHQDRNREMVVMDAEDNDATFSHETCAV